MSHEHLVRPTSAGCAFCDYLSKVRPFTILWEDHDSAIFVTREQRGIGHLLILPKRHAPNILEITDSEAAKLAVVARRAAEAISISYQPAGISIWQNNGIAAGQVIDHFHIHVAGTLPDGGTDWGAVPELDLVSTELIGQKIRSNLR